MFRYSIIDNTGGGIFGANDLQQMVKFADFWGIEFSRAWGIDGICGDVITNITQLQAGNIAVSWLKNDSNVPGAAGFHDETGGVPFIELLTDPFLNAGGGIFDGGNAGVSLLSVLLHEIGETVVDLYVDDWVMMPDGRFIAKEVSDPVQIIPFKIGLPDGSVGLGSDYVFPSYFDNQAIMGQFDDAGAISAPFQLSPGGYQIIYDPSQFANSNGPISNVFGHKVPEWLKEYKLNNARGRTHKRIPRGFPKYPKLSAR